MQYKIVTLYQIDFRFPFPSNPPVLEVKWFGKGERPTTTSVDDTKVRPFKIDIKDSVLDDLKTRLKLDLARLKTDHQERLQLQRF